MLIFIDGGKYASGKGARIMMKEKIAKVGAQIKQIRLMHRLSQKELADKIGISQASLSNIECGRNNCTLENLIKLSEVLECPVRDFFVELDGKFTKEKQGEVFTLDELVNALLYLKK